MNLNLNQTDLTSELQLSKASIVSDLSRLVDLFPNQIVFSTSFGLEDQVITHLIASNNLPIQIFTLDTGRNFQETYSTWSKTLIQYGISISSFVPNEQSLSDLISSKGPNSFYSSVADRKACCSVRKVEPLARALTNKKVWITGIRADQSQNRTTMQAIEHDAAHNLIKFHPLFDWTFDEVKAFVSEYQIPYNPLHDQGFLSIGCAPCTRAIQPGEDFRAGRWWWEDQSKKECGLHTLP